ncbi:SPOR domain-containing protein [Stappia sp. WLB 29]|uniref:SPOR domain-containing protein n=1 Tax=Stappia sp. WLB 29 TaxID=2925220 RepID=UPI0020BFFACF|nr:SPOR domain-containing protein [Stappia sp. WLB 29]
MSSRSNYPVQGQRGDRYQADAGQSGDNAGFEEDPLVELARIVSEGNARYRPVALGAEGEAPAVQGSGQGSYDASRDLIDHEAWARELEAGLSDDFGTYAPETYEKSQDYQGQDYQDQAYAGQAYEDPHEGYPQDEAEALADDSFPQDRREAETLAPQPYVDEVYADRALVDEGLADPQDPYARQPYAEDGYTDENYAEPDAAEAQPLDAYARRAAEVRAAPAYAPAQLWAGSATQTDDAGYYDEDAADDFADELAAEEAAAPDPLASLEDELLGALRGPRAAEPAWGAGAAAEAASDDYAEEGAAEGDYQDDEYEQDGYEARRDEDDDDLLGLGAVSGARHYGTAAATGAMAAGAASPRYRDEYDEAVDDIFVGETEAPPPPGGYDLDEVAQAMREGDPQLGGHGVLPPHSEREQEAAEPAAKSKRGLYVAAAVLGVVVLGGSVFALTNLGDDEMSGPPPVITADGEDLKVYPDSQTSSSDGQNKLIYDRVGSDGDERLVLQDETPVASLPPAPLTGNDDADGSGVSSGPRKVRTVVVRPDGTIISGDAPGRTAPGAATAPATDTATTPAGDTARIPGTGPEEPATANGQPTTDANGVRQVSTMPITNGAGEGAQNQLTSTLDAAGQAANGAANQLSGDVSTQTPDQTPGQTPEPAAANGGTETAGTDPMAPNVPRTKPDDIDTLAANAAAPSQAEPARNTQAPLDLTAQAPRVPAPTAPAQPQQPSATQASAPATGSIPAGTYIVQVSSQRTQEQAQAAFGDLQRRYGAVLGGVSPVIERADLGDRGTFYRVRIPTSSRDDAISLCERLKSAGGDCFVRRN